MTNAFDHERLDVYRVALEVLPLADDTAEQLPQGRAHIADQLRRAATSIVLNIAEGAGEFSGSEKARFYRIARRSAAECAAVLDVVRKLKLGDETRLAQQRDLLLRIVAMLVALSRAQKSGSGSGSGSGSTRQARQILRAHST